MFPAPPDYSKEREKWYVQRQADDKCWFYLFCYKNKVFLGFINYSYIGAEFNTYPNMPKENLLLISI